MKLTNCSIDKKYFSFEEPINLTATVTMGSGESLALYDGVYGWIYSDMVIANDFFVDKTEAYKYVKYGNNGGRFSGERWYYYDYDLRKNINQWHYNNFTVSLMFEPTVTEEEKGESYYVFSSLASLAAGKSKTYNRKCWVPKYEAGALLNYINNLYEDDNDHKFYWDSKEQKIKVPNGTKIKDCYQKPVKILSEEDSGIIDITKYEYFDEDLNKTITDYCYEYGPSDQTQPILDYTKRRFPIRISAYAGDMRDTTWIYDVLSSTTKTTLAQSPSDIGYTANVDLGCFILFRLPPQIEGFQIIDNWCDKIIEENPEIPGQMPKFLIAQGYSELIFKPKNIITDQEVDPSITFSSCTLKITRSDIGEVCSIISEDPNGIITVPPAVFTDQGLYSFVYTVFDSTGESTQIEGQFYAEKYEPPKATFSVERTILERNGSSALGYDSLISDEGVYLRTYLQISNSVFKNPFGTGNETTIPNQISYLKNWINNDNPADKPMEKLPTEEINNTELANYDFFNKYHLLSDHIISNTNLNPYQYFQYELSENEEFEFFTLDPKISIKNSLTFLCGPEIRPEEDEDMFRYFFEYFNANEYQITLLVQDYFKTYAFEALTIERTGGLLNIEMGGVAIGMRHPDPLNEQAPSFLINYPTTFLQPMILVEGVHFGAQLPTSGVQGQIFYLLVDKDE